MSRVWLDFGFRGPVCDLVRCAALGDGCFDRYEGFARLAPLAQTPVELAQLALGRTMERADILRAVLMARWLAVRCPGREPARRVRTIPCCRIAQLGQVATRVAAVRGPTPGIQNGWHRCSLDPRRLVSRSRRVHPKGPGCWVPGRTVAFLDPLVDQLAAAAEQTAVPPAGDPEAERRAKGYWARTWASRSVLAWRPLAWAKPCWDGPDAPAGQPSRWTKGPS